ncbi:MAG: ABC transporter ATP-binding protein [Candidatus Dojkabacteria bacterium]|nr:ABC transporter ATP-binding protein [Candidatus Dojkabacteria bacterium]MDQ7020362.1 ABC transporter ATP-binding protein [Candidatus Dojkabacteria bacterium]
MVYNGELRQSNDSCCSYDFISPLISLTSILVIIVTVPFLLLSIKMNIKQRERLKDAEYDRNSTIIDGVSNFETVRSFGKEDYEVKYLDKKLEIAQEAQFKYQDTFRLIDFVARLAGVFVFIVPAVVTNTLYTEGNLTLGEVVVILTYLTQMTGRVMGMIFNIRDVLKDLPTIEDFYELYDAKPSIKYINNPQIISEVRGNISFQNVSFGYTSDISVINDLN